MVMRRSIWGGILAVFCKDLAVGMLGCNLQKSTRRLSKPRAEGAYDSVRSSPACLQALGLPLCPKLYDILIFPLSATGLAPSSQSHVHEHEGVCVCLFCGALYILSALEVGQRLLPNPVSLGSSIP